MASYSGLVSSPPPPTSLGIVYKVGDIIEIVFNSDGYHNLPLGTQVEVMDVHPTYMGALTAYSVKAIEFPSPTATNGGVVGQQWTVIENHVGPSHSGHMIPKVTLDSVIIADSKKEEIRAAISQVENDDLIFKEWGFDDVFEKGTAISLLFWGIPGTGKTLMAQAIADETNGELKIYGTADIQSSEPGGAERMIKMIFSEAKKKNKAKKGEKRVILFDECDSLLTDRNEVGVILGAQVNTLLTEIEKYEGIIIFTTNRMGKLDPALERRITAKIEFTFPDKEQRKAIWERMIPKKAPLAKDVDVDRLADYPLAGGNIKNAVLNAARKAAYKKEKKISMQFFTDAIEGEARSLQAFADEYEKQSHSSFLGYATQNAHGSLVVKQDMKQDVKADGVVIEPKKYEKRRRTK